jgi:hypothetical protein
LNIGVVSERNAEGFHAATHERLLSHVRRFTPGLIRQTT